MRESDRYGEHLDDIISCATYIMYKPESYLNGDHELYGKIVEINTKRRAVVLKFQKDYSKVIQVTLKKISDADKAKNKEEWSSKCADVDFNVGFDAVHLKNLNKKNWKITNSPEGWEKVNAIYRESYRYYDFVQLHLDCARWESTFDEVVGTPRHKELRKILK